MRKSTLFALMAVTIILVTGTIAAAANFPSQKRYHQNQSQTTAFTTLPDVEITIDEITASGFTRPVQVTHAGDGSQRLFVVEQTGKITILKDGAVLNTPFIDLTNKVVCCGERGLLGVAFHPEYPSNGYFFVNYTRASDGATVIARYQVSAGDPDLADPTSATILLTIPQPYTNHNGGQLLFSPLDGYLYIGMGDGGSGGDPINSGQDTSTFLGAMLRLDVDSGSPYTIPSDNPFVGTEGLDEIWAYGLRNPWRFSFDRQNGDLYIGDVGQNLWEEISYQVGGTPGGTNFGWRCKEGTHNYNFTGDCLTAFLTDPITEYSHSVGFSVSGGFVYRGVACPNMVGRYFYADYVEGKIWSLYKSSENPTTWSLPELELDTGLNISGFGEDETGELYLVDYSGGTIRHLADVSGPVPNLSTSRKMVSSPSADQGEVVTYTLWLTNTGGIPDQPVVLTDTIPSGLAYIAGSLTSNQGLVDDSGAPTLIWTGNLSESPVMSVTYRVQVAGLVTGSLVNRAVLATSGIPPLTLAASLSIPRSVLNTTVVDFTTPGTQPGDLDTPIPTAVDCDTCHTAPVYDRWRGSLMSQSGRDPLMWAALHVANIDAPNAGEFCLRCHTPKGWYAGRSHPADGSALEPEDINSGVACALCHRMVDPIPSTSDEAVLLDQAIRGALSNPVPDGFVGSGALILDPADNRRGPFSFTNNLPYHTAYQTDYFDQVAEAITRSRLCGSCHNVSNPVLSWDVGRGQYWPNPMDSPPPAYMNQALFPVETTFDEWLYSEFARGGVSAPQFAGADPDGIVETCQDCHMVRTTGNPADPAFNPTYRDCQTTGCLPEHTFVGGNTWVPELLTNPAWRLSAPLDSTYLSATIGKAELMLDKAASITATLGITDSGKVATVRVVNHTGHKLPTGYPEGRQMWTNLRAYDASGQVIYESGAYDSQTGQLIRDEDIKVYEAKQGLTPELATVLGKTSGESFHFVLNNTVIKDNRIPPRGYTRSNFDQPGLRPVGADYDDGQYWDDTTYLLPPGTEWVQVTLYYQTASREYIQFLKANGGVDGDSLGQLWNISKSPPEIIARVITPGIILYFPLVFGP